MHGKQLEECIVARSHLLWERAGGVPGHENEYWELARVEVEREVTAALDGEETNFVPPHLTISQRPLRRTA